MQKIRSEEEMRIIGEKVSKSLKEHFEKIIDPEWRGLSTQHLLKQIIIECDTMDDKQNEFLGEKCKVKLSSDKIINNVKINVECKRPLYLMKEGKFKKNYKTTVIERKGELLKQLRKNEQGERMEECKVTIKKDIPIRQEDNSIKITPMEKQYITNMLFISFNNPK